MAGSGEGKKRAPPGPGAAPSPTAHGDPRFSADDLSADSVDSAGIDIGGTGIKGAPVDTDKGELTAERHRILTPHPATPDAVAAHLGRGEAAQTLGLTQPLQQEDLWPLVDAVLFRALPYPEDQPDHNQAEGPADQGRQRRVAGDAGLLPSRRRAVTSALLSFKCET